MRRLSGRISSNTPVRMGLLSSWAEAKMHCRIMLLKVPWEMETAYSSFTGGIQWNSPGFSLCILVRARPLLMYTVLSWV